MFFGFELTFWSAFIIILLCAIIPAVLLVWAWTLCRAASWGSRLEEQRELEQFFAEMEEGE